MAERPPAIRPSGLWSRTFDWLDRRTGIDALLSEALDEPIPGGARFAYVFGSGLLFLFLSQLVTGVTLALYYVPSADHAHATVEYITKEVAAGSFLRSLHSYGSSAMVVLLLLHIAQTFFFGSYKGRREVLWLSGCVLFGLTIGMAFTGYLLPWDMKAYFATAVGTNIASEIPVIGESLKSLMRGGADMGTMTVSRFFVAHVFLLPGAILLFVAFHVYLFRKSGAAGPINENPVQPRLPAERFYPKQVAMDMAFALVLILALGILSYVAPVELGPKADPAATQYVPRPEWYYLPVFQWLKYWPGGLSIVGIVVVPAIVIVLFVGLPFIDRSIERRPWKRPLATGAFVVVFLSLVGLGLLSYRDDRSDPGVRRQIERQHEETRAFMEKRFEPVLTGTLATAGTPVPADPIAARGKVIYDEQACGACHGDAGEGTPAGSALTGITARIPTDRLVLLLREPSQPMRDGGMTPLELTDEDFQALISHLASLR